MTRNPIEKIIIIIIKPLFTALFARSYGDYNITPDMLLIVFHSKLQHLKFYDFTCFPTRGYFFYNNYCYPCFFCTQQTGHGGSDTRKSIEKRPEEDTQ